MARNKFARKANYKARMGRLYTLPVDNVNTTKQSTVTRSARIHSEELVEEPMVVELELVVVEALPMAPQCLWRMGPRFKRLWSS